MLRTPLGKCQGGGAREALCEAASTNRQQYQNSPGMWLANSGETDHRGTLGRKMARKYVVSPIPLSTTVLLTRTGPNPILLGIGHCPTHQGRRKLIELMVGGSVYLFETGSQPELLDIGAIEDKLASWVVIPRRHNVTQSQGCISCHARVGWRNEPEDRRCNAHQRRSCSRHWRSAAAAHAARAVNR